MTSADEIEPASPRSRPPWHWLATPPRHLAAFAHLWRNVTIAGLAQELARREPDFVALIDGQRAMTRKEWLEEAQALAAAMADTGLQPGDVVAFQLPNWHEAGVLNLACAIGGFVINPIVPIYRDAEVRQMLQDCGARAIFSCGMHRGFDFAAMARRLRDELPDLRHVFVVRPEAGEVHECDYARLLETGRDLPRHPAATDPDAVKMVLYTSGTTGRPKGVLHSHNTIEHIVRSSYEHWGVRPGDTIIMPSPVTHISGYANGLEAPLICGTRVVLMERWDADTAIELIARHGVSGTVAATPFLVELAAAARLASTRLPSMRWFACGGAAVPADLIPAANRAFDNMTAFRVFGASEVPLVTYGWPHDEHLAATTDGKVVSYDVKIADDDGTHLPAGVEGEILARGPSMMLGYANHEQSAEAIDDEGYFRTGDLGRLSADGALTVTGRKKDLIIRGGENISAAEIEDVLRSHPAVRDVSVVAMPHERLGEGVCAFVVGEGTPASEQDLCDHVAASGLARQKIPERFVFVDDFPRTASGKVRKDVLRADARTRAG
ncbi:AMP-binding protein [Croceicoccus sp. F390]|uniref:AMP-binding protein n=1 Tax=Croceicoccus esteveae TaxID=3075597 RepID=A0ABU2ZK82_9SPHN|nr:AMP-binding protein [Croceicoccus sp. F390]MDT0575984.1 AMP-binding protein [Croceicoccus sp. F390]